MPAAWYVQQVAGCSAGITVDPFLKAANQIVEQFVVGGKDNVDTAVGLLDLGYPANSLDAAQFLLHAAAKPLEIVLSLQRRDPREGQGLAFVAVGGSYSE